MTSREKAIEKLLKGYKELLERYLQFLDVLIDKNDTSEAAKRKPKTIKDCKDTIEEIDQALALLKPAEENPIPHTAYQAFNKVSTMFFADREDAEIYAGNCGAAAGIQVYEIFVMPSSKLEKPAGFICSLCGKTFPTLSEYRGHGSPDCKPAYETIKVFDIDMTLERVLQNVLANVQEASSPNCIGQGRYLSYAETYCKAAYEFVRAKPTKPAPTGQQGQKGE